MVDNAISKAHSRAAVLQSLRTNLGNDDKNRKYFNSKEEIISTVTNNVNYTMKESINIAIDLIQDAVNDKSVKSRNFIFDSLKGKTIIVENIQRQIDASKLKIIK
jgi:hypothetical protein